MEIINPSSSTAVPTESNLVTIDILGNSEKITLTDFTLFPDDDYSPLAGIEGELAGNTINAFQRIGSGVSSEGTDLYFADDSGTSTGLGRGRLIRYSLTQKKITGWMGIVDDTPTGGVAGCTTTKRGMMTPGWCTGGTTAIKAGEAADYSTGYGPATISGSYLYVSHINGHRISRYNLATGAFAGWIGKIYAPPTSPPSCASAPIGNTTPTWCYGGASTSGNSTGQYNAPAFITSDSTNLYISDRSNHRIQRVNIASGVADGWIGRVASNTGLAPSVANGNATNGWSVGGAPQSGPALGALNTPSGLVISGAFLYVVDRLNTRIQRFNLSTGITSGWIGRVGTTAPTTGGGNCATAVTGDYAYGWCTSGLASNGLFGNGSFHDPVAITKSTDGLSMYVTNAGGSGYIQKFAIADGGFQGWFGRVGSVSPTGDAPGLTLGCSTKTLGQTTPGWCMGGTIDPVRSHIDGQFNQPAGITVVNNKIYIVDYIAAQLSRTDEVSGEFEGRVGSGAKLGTSWKSIYKDDGSYFKVIRDNGGTLTSDVFQILVGLTGENNILYVADSTARKVLKIDKSSGEVLGWIGGVGSTPTGGEPGCTSALSGTMTPGWCTGGSSLNGNGTSSGFNIPNKAVFNKTSIFVTDSAAQTVLKFDKETGAFQGWVGRVSSISGITGCVGAVAGATTPGWCFGGTAQTGGADGQYLEPRGAAVHNNELFIGDKNNRITKLNASTGAFIGWIGLVKTSPTAGASGCSNATSGQPTPGWCVGGASAPGSDDGEISGSSEITVDNNFLYVVTEGNGRIRRYIRSNGARAGWIGNEAKFSTNSITGSSGNFSSHIDGGFMSARGLTSDNNYYYVSEGFGSVNTRFMRFLKSNFSFQGWIGAFSTQPSGDAEGSYGGCTGATVANPGWCLGGTGGSSLTALGAYSNTPSPPVVVGGFMYVSDYYRIVKIDVATGQAVGWIGRATANTGLLPVVTAGSATNGWSTGGTPGSGSGDGHFFNSLVRLTTDGVNLYAFDFNGKVSKFLISTGVFQGWSGLILTSPTGGDAGCNGAAIGTMTPGWCRGGTPGLNILSPRTVYGFTYFDHHLYAMSENALFKFNENGSYEGWSGTVGSTPTGGDAGCTTTPIGSYTPGWCLGGVGMPSVNEESDGYSSSLGMAIDANYIYLSSSTSGRITRHHLSTGVPDGWVGVVGKTPTGGASGCTSLQPFDVTPGWCKGGESINGLYSMIKMDKSNSAIELFYNLGGLHVENNNLWVARPQVYGVSTVFGINATTGALLNKSIGGVSATAHKPWANGGSTATSCREDSLCAIRGVTTNSKYIYVTDNVLSRIQRYEKATGLYRGWMGIVGLTPPTSGSPGCTTMSYAGLTPGWCYGGQALETSAATTGSKGSQVDFPFRELFGVYADGDDLYLAGISLIYRLNGAAK